MSGTEVVTLQHVRSEPLIHAQIARLFQSRTPPHRVDLSTAWVPLALSTLPSGTRRGPQFKYLPYLLVAGRALFSSETLVVLWNEPEVVSHVVNEARLVTREWLSRSYAGVGSDDYDFLEWDGSFEMVWGALQMTLAVYDSASSLGEGILVSVSGMLSGPQRGPTPLEESAFATPPSRYKKHTPAKGCEIETHTRKRSPKLSHSDS